MIWRSPRKRDLSIFRWIRIFSRTKRFGCYAVSLALLECWYCWRHIAGYTTQRATGRVNDDEIKALMGEVTPLLETSEAADAQA